MRENNKGEWLVIGFLLVVIIALTAVNLSKSRVTLISKQGFGKYEKLHLVLDQIERNYVDEMNAAELVEKAIPEIFKALDPHSVYMPPTILKKAEQQLEGQFDGIGIMFNAVTDTATVIKTVKDGPAEKSGILSGDRIIYVDSIMVAGVKIPQDSLMGLMRGKSGTTVRLGIKRYGENELLYKDVVRAKIPDNSIEVAYMMNDTTGFIKLSKFSKTCYKEFMIALASLMSKGMTQLVFDIRDNTGGFLEQAYMLSNEFLRPGQLIVYTEGTHRKRQNFTATKTGVFSTQPLVLLIDEYSASASEILAGALQDNDRGVIVGRRSFGKGLVQEPIGFSDNSGMRLTVARYYTPTGRCLQKPYNSMLEYSTDIYERYRHGELICEDSIPKNDSLRFVTPKGKSVYGGGGIIPDIFVPLDTTGVNPLSIEITRKGISSCFANRFFDQHKSQLKEIKDFKQLDAYLAKCDIERSFISFVKQSGVKFNNALWKKCKGFILPQVKALIGRYTPLDDEAFYSYWNSFDNVVNKALDVLADPTINKTF